MLVWSVLLVVDSKTPTKKALFFATGRWTHQGRAHSHSLFFPARFATSASEKSSFPFTGQICVHVAALWLLKGSSSYLWPFCNCVLKCLKHLWSWCHLNIMAVYPVLLHSLTKEPTTPDPGSYFTSSPNMTVNPRHVTSVFYSQLVCNNST